MDEKRPYIKDNPEKESFEIEVKKQTFDRGGVMPTIQLSAYTKPEATLLPRSFFVIFSGGAEREKDYFYLIDKNPSLYTNIKIDFWAEPNFQKGGKPKIGEFAICKVKEYKESASQENPDSYYLLTDVDHFGNFLPEMRHECEENNINMIISNSCFEVWLYFSERSDKCADFKPPLDQDKISSEFKKWAGEQIGGGLKPRKALLKIEQNIENARANYSANDNDFPTLFSTQMFRLAEKILPYVLEGNEKITASRAKRH